MWAPCWPHELCYLGWNTHIFSLYHFMDDLNEIVRQFYISLYRRYISNQFSTHIREIARWSLFQAYLKTTVKFMMYIDILMHPYGYRIFLKSTATWITWEPCTNSRPYLPAMVYNSRMDNKEPTPKYILSYFPFCAVVTEVTAIYL